MRRSADIESTVIATVSGHVLASFLAAHRTSSSVYISSAGRLKSTVRAGAENGVGRRGAGNWKEEKQTRRRFVDEHVPY